MLCKQKYFPVTFTQMSEALRIIDQIMHVVSHRSDKFQVENPQRLIIEIEPHERNPLIPVSPSSLHARQHDLRE